MSAVQQEGLILENVLVLDLCPEVEGNGIFSADFEALVFFCDLDDEKNAKKQIVYRMHGLCDMRAPKGERFALSESSVDEFTQMVEHMETLNAHAISGLILEVLECIREAVENNPTLGLA